MKRLLTLILVLTYFLTKAQTNPAAFKVESQKNSINQIVSSKTLVFKSYRYGQMDSITIVPPSPRKLFLMQYEAYPCPEMTYDVNKMQTLGWTVVKVMILNQRDYILIMQKL
jgi:hypothetical protein